MSRGRLIVVAGPSGVGKGSVISAVLSKRPQTWPSVSTTTRPPRPGEIGGQDYFFVTESVFVADVTGNGFLEWAEYAGNRYGTARAPVLAHLAAGQNVILEIELAGARQVRATFPEAVLVLMKPPSMSVLRDRLAGRATETPEAMERRMTAAEIELAAADEFDYVLVNEDILETAQKLVQLIDEQ
jgi:guanylate kinase